MSEDAIRPAAEAMRRVMEGYCDEPLAGRKARADDERTAYSPAVAKMHELQEQQLANEQAPRTRGREFSLLERVEALEARLAALEALCAEPSTA